MWTQLDRQAIGVIAERHGFSDEAAIAMTDALASGGGRMAQFSHPELGGMGQWSFGGMLMIGDMFNNALKARVGALAADLSAGLGDGTIKPPSRDDSVFAGTAGWWPDHLGSPASSGAQNGVRYAVFPDRRRLALERGGAVSLFDTGEHLIGGVSQQQGGPSTLRFSSQLGTVRVEDLAEISDGAAPSGSAPHARRDLDTPSAGFGDRPAAAAIANPMRASPTPPSNPPASTAPASAAPAGPRTPSAGTGAEIVDTLRRLAELRSEGILSDAEFAAKKAELLGRL